VPPEFPSPTPPFAVGTGLPWDVPVVGDAVAPITDARRRHGDTFAVVSGADRYLFTFSPDGVESFYALPQDKASKGAADYPMLRRKLPDEIFAGPGRQRRDPDRWTGHRLAEQATLASPMHQSGQHTEADPVGQPIRMTVSTTGIVVGHRCQ
jgi:hypothetical protein